MAAGANDPDPGQCGQCMHARPARNGRGSVFWRCGRAADDPSFPKYPRLPVGQCRGFEADTPVGGPGGGPGADADHD